MQMKTATLVSKTYDVDDFAAAQEFYHSNAWTDGLPVVPPTEIAVKAPGMGVDAAGPAQSGSSRSAPSRSLLRSSLSMPSWLAACRCTFPWSPRRGRP
jgi:hypothetical protein